MPEDLLANATAVLATGLETGDVQPLLDELHSLLHKDLVLLTVLVFAPLEAKSIGKNGPYSQTRGLWTSLLPRELSRMRLGRATRFLRRSVGESWEAQLVTIGA